MPSVGEILAAERRRQGKSLNDVVDGTKIRSRLLDALEDGRYDELPSPAYVKGYIQSYARYLEIPVEPLLEQFRLEASTHDGKRRLADKYLDIPHETIVPERLRAHSIPREVWIVTAVVIIVVVLLLCALTRLLGGGGGTGTMPTNPKPGGSEVTASPGPGSDAATTTTVRKSTGFKLRVTVREGQASWVQATVDDLQVFEGSLQSGASREWLATKSAVLRVGKPSALVVTRDGKPVTIPPGGEVSELKLNVAD